MTSNNLAIQMNHDPVSEACPLCGLPTNPNIGPELFLDRLVVCRACGQDREPVLSSLVNLCDAAREFVAAENDFGLFVSRTTDIPTPTAHGFRVIQGGATADYTSKSIN